MNENNWVTPYGEIDIFWNENCEGMKDIDNVTIVTQGEGGLTTLLVGDAITSNSDCKQIGLFTKWVTVS